ncbi:Putative clathrin assembly protein At5g35200 [Linum perenne]
MSGGGTQKSLRKALGSIKDTTTVSLAKINSDYKELDIAIVKATNHVERPAKEKHIRAIFAAISATRPRADVAYCIHALARRLSKTHNWAVALKTLVIIHRALREVDPTFHEELINYGRSRSHMLNMSHFKDDSSPNAWDYSAWVRTYALFLEERMECFRVLKYDIEADRPRTKDLETAELLDQLPALQQLLSRVLNCQPQGAAVSNFIIRLALSMVASESVKIYQAITDGTENLVDKFFEMPRPDAVKALEIYRRACQQAERLSEFYEICKSVDIGRGERFIKIEQPPASFLQTMEEYVRDAPRMSTANKDQKPEPVKEEQPPVVAPPDLLVSHLTQFFFWHVCFQGNAVTRKKGSDALSCTVSFSYGIVYLLLVSRTWMIRSALLLQNLMIKIPLRWLLFQLVSYFRTLVRSYLQMKNVVCDCGISCCR